MQYYSSISYFISLFLFIFYLILKYNKRKYIISAFNVGLFSYAFIIFLMPIIFFYNNKSWYALGIKSASSMRYWLSKSVLINSLGFTVSLLVLIYYEFNKKKSTWIERKTIKLTPCINSSILKIFFWIMIIVWYYIVFKYNHTLPILNGGRTFYVNLGISPIYLASKEIISIYVLYFGITYINNKRNLFKFLLATLTLFFGGSRSSLLIDTITPLAIIYIYQISKGKSRHIMNNSEKKKAIRKILMMMPFVAIVGIIISIFRSGSIISQSSIIREFFYGNTFSDIRDGAHILKRFSEKGNLFLYGKTYIAALISFIPSSVSNYRTIWSWGRFSTVYLFNMNNHLGFRGGNSMEAYFNFGFFGVIFMGMFWGALMGMLERIFYIFVLEQKQITGKEYFIWMPFIGLRSAITISSGTYNIYVDFLFLILILCVSNFFAIPGKTYNRKT